MISCKLHYFQVHCNTYFELLGEKVAHCTPYGWSSKDTVCSRECNITSRVFEIFKPSIILTIKIDFIIFFDFRLYIRWIEIHILMNYILIKTYLNWFPPPQHWQWTGRRWRRGCWGVGGCGLSSAPPPLLLSLSWLLSSACSWSGYANTTFYF